MRPLFVVGAPRSGTTLLLSLLRGVRGVYLPPDEFQILQGFTEAVEAGADAHDLAALLEASTFGMHMRRRGIWPDPHDLIDLLEGKTAAIAFRDLILEIARLEGVSDVAWWGDKTPETVFALDLVARLWPDARIVHVQRDPRSTVLSMHRAWGRSLTRGSVIWRDAIRSAETFAHEHPDRIRTVFFEELTADPEQQMTSLARWLDAEFDPAILSQVTSGERWGQATGATGVVDRSPDWHAHLTHSQVCLIEEICFTDMKRLGFPVHHATGVKEPGQLTQKALRVKDAVQVLRSYAKERGWRNALAYKLSQWRNSS